MDIFKKDNTTVELINAYERMSHAPEHTYGLTTVSKVTIKRTSVYIIPFGEDYECEGGHHCEILTESEFNKRYSTKLLE